MQTPNFLIYVMQHRKHHHKQEFKKFFCGLSKESNTAHNLVFTLSRLEGLLSHGLQRRNISYFYSPAKLAYSVLHHITEIYFVHSESPSHGFEFQISRLPHDTHVAHTETTTWNGTQLEARNCSGPLFFPELEPKSWICDQLHGS